MTSFIKSRQRVVDHGEVFTPPEIVDAMLDLVKTESERIDSRFLEPACGSGNFLIAVLRRKLATVEARYGKNEFERRHYALLALMSLYGIEILEDNVEECRALLLDEFGQFVVNDRAWLAAGRAALDANIVWADAITMKLCPEGKRPITFAEWSYLGKGRFQRRDFLYVNLAHMSSLRVDTLFGTIAQDDPFEPTREYPPMTYEEVAHV